MRTTTKTKRTKQAVDARRLVDLDGVGKATRRDLARLGIDDVRALARQDPDALYARLGALDGAAHDPCVLDVLRCAVAQARDPALPEAQRRWWWWSAVRKEQGA